MRSKGCHGASTIHSLIYRARESGEETPSFELWNDAPASKAKLIVIDECSMVDAELGRDLMSFGVPVLVLGDPAQLPPIQGGGFFTDAEPDAMLTEVHRQAQDNPIVRLSMEIRAGNAPEPGKYGETQVVRRDALDPQRVIDADQVLVGRNATRRAYNARMRERRGFADALPMAGDKLVCLRNNRRKGLFNGGLWTVKERPKDAAADPAMHLRPDEDLGERTVKVSVRPECFTGGIEELEWPQRKRYDEFDFRLRAHRAQGAGLAMGRRRAVRRVRRVPRQPRALALYRRHAGGEAADGRGVNRRSLARMKRSEFGRFPATGHHLPHRVSGSTAAPAREGLLAVLLPLPGDRALPHRRPRPLDQSPSE